VSLVAVVVSLVTVAVSVAVDAVEAVDVSAGRSVAPSATQLKAILLPETVVTETASTQKTVRDEEHAGHALFGTFSAAFAAGATIARRLAIIAKALTPAISDFFIFPPSKYIHICGPAFAGPYSLTALGLSVYAVLGAYFWICLVIFLA
jgi:hypothetical protein